MLTKGRTVNSSSPEASNEWYRSPSDLSVSPIHTHFLLLPWLLHLSIYLYWQCFKGICSLLVNVITERQICDADSEASLTSLTSWEFTQFLWQNQPVRFKVFFFPTFFLCLFLSLSAHAQVLFYDMFTSTVAVFFIKLKQLINQLVDWLFWQMDNCFSFFKQKSQTFSGSDKLWGFSAFLCPNFGLLDKKAICWHHLGL